ncbi:MAG TPA: inorganic phosphate transporter [Candidatus Methylacidiphilales bacterium]|nr:inorganic phosphate transporter [Candidatus Methylacidiphilales bacterium]
MELWGESIPFATAFFLLLALALALSFEFVNGFHDTANAVATVIYTNTLKPTWAVVWSGIWNLLGVLSSNGAVAYGIVALLPVELVLKVGSGAGFAMVFALLISAIIWNVGTWYLGLPASSSHTMIGSIMGVGVANSIMNGDGWMAGINWEQTQKVIVTLLVSPIVGFIGSAILLLICKALIQREDFFRAPEKETPPPLWIRGILVFTCTFVSFKHGSNDGQKGMGLIMLIMVGLLPGAFAVNMASTHESLQKTSSELRQMATALQPQTQGVVMSADDSDKELSYLVLRKGKLDNKVVPALVAKAQAVSGKLDGLQTFSDLPQNDRRGVRTDLFLISETIGKLVKANRITDKPTLDALTKCKSDLDAATKYIPDWVKVAVALALGCGTMVGWKRIVVTVGEKIGKSHLTYAQGASAELIAGLTIQGADSFGLPVSTTHVLSSGIAGTMAANRSGLQTQTLVNILLAWVLTLPVCVFLGATLFSAALYVTFHVFGAH